MASWPSRMPLPGTAWTSRSVYTASHTTGGEMNVLYTAEATATGGRDGRARTSDGTLDLSLKPPKELGGPGGDATNPEQLFAAGYGACYLSALSLIARSQKISAKKFSVNARIDLGHFEGD